MKKQKYLFNDDIAIDAHHEKQASIFRDEFETELNRRFNEEDAFSDELQHIQKLTMVIKSTHNTSKP